ncbi:hypothetical protein BRADI_3g03926v3 [Brachypodium distachyon]|uniref:Uncharacterized protein n=1 Tax=Brachypodium distachyon TaxID=15368 RepID=A0A0Q3PV97_BRADI|nr:hypothetical protein BRADI_3g03926v3 [Brachypodium distachyon]
MEVGGGSPPTGWRQQERGVPASNNGTGDGGDARERRGWGIDAPAMTLGYGAPTAVGHDAVATKKVCTSKMIQPAVNACDPRTCQRNAENEFTKSGAQCPDHSVCTVQGHCVPAGCKYTE